MSLLQRAIVPFIIVALVVAGAIVMFSGDGGDKTLTAYFPRTVSLYEGSDVRVLGVAVGKIESVTPEGTRVKVVVKYDGDIKVPADAQAVIISPSIVGDRYVQLTPVYDGGDGAGGQRQPRRGPAPRCRSSSTRSTPASTG